MTGKMISYAHRCQIVFAVNDPEAHPGSVWQCECGKRWYKVQ